MDIAGMSLQQKMAALHEYRESQYRQLQDAVYARRGWDADGVPTLGTLKNDGIDFPELTELVEQHAHKG
ncbi:MAG: hypothetical protein NTZ77_01350 [Caldiserica bacterium]|nr:hypothetical protein [Caldisericota bacterium]